MLFRSKKLFRSTESEKGEDESIHPDARHVCDLGIDRSSTGGRCIFKGIRSSGDAYRRLDLSSRASNRSGDVYRRLVVMEFIRRHSSGSNETLLYRLLSRRRLMVQDIDALLLHLQRRGEIDAKTSEEGIPPIQRGSNEQSCACGVGKWSSCKATQLFP